MNSAPFDLFQPGILENKLTDASDRQTFFESEEFQQLMDERLSALFPENNLELLTLDLFDTVLLRDDKSELTRFWDIAQKMADFLSDHGLHYAPEEVLLARYMASQVAYRVSHPVKGCREGTLLDIHAGILNVLSVEEDLVDSLINIELEAEKSVLTFNQGLWRWVEQVQAKGVMVYIVSDMYLQQKQIESLLDHFLGEGRKIVTAVLSSADFKISKASGHIFNEISDMSGIEKGSILHLGDSKVGDFQMPIRRGARAIHLPRPNNIELRALEDQEKALIALQERGYDFYSWIYKN